MHILYSNVSICKIVSCLLISISISTTVSLQISPLSTTKTTISENKNRIQTVGTAKTRISASASRSSSDTSTRRQWFTTAAGVTTSLFGIALQPSNAEPSFLSTLQSPIQDAVAPGHWLGEFAGINSKTETWEFPTHSRNEVSLALVDVLTNLTKERRSKLLIPEINIKRADATNVHVLTWTKLEWLDTLDVTFKDSDRNSNGCTATARFYATGFLPTNIPLAPLLNVVMAWFPFGSPGPRGEMLQDFRLRALKGLVTKKLLEEEQQQQTQQQLVL
mmetsp:Transcript_44689/g.50098  ORF Transcript_44689/g.50098 Transcript_44689/m.50098 type:complete len:276 (+) Transcript_44689:54-881(+)